MLPILYCSILLFRLDITMDDLSFNLDDVDVDFLLAEDADYTTLPSVLSSQERKGSLQATRKRIHG